MPRQRLVLVRLTGCCVGCCVVVVLVVLTTVRPPELPPPPKSVPPLPPPPPLPRISLSSDFGLSRSSEFGPWFTGENPKVVLEPEDGDGDDGVESCTVPRTHDPDLLAAGYSQRSSCSPHLRFRGGVG